MFLIVEAYLCYRNIYVIHNIPILARTLAPLLLKKLLRNVILEPLIGRA